MSSDKDESKGLDQIRSAFSSLWDTIWKKHLSKILGTVFKYEIILIFVHFATVVTKINPFHKGDDHSEKQKRIRSKQIDENDPSSPYRAVEVVEKLQNQPERKVQTLAVIPDLCLERFPDKQTMGVRQILDVIQEKQKDGKTFQKFVLGEYQFQTYRDIYARIDAIGRGILTLGGKQGDHILLYSDTRPEWLCTAFAAFRHGLTLVTLLSTLNEEALKHAINESGVEIVITSEELLPNLHKIFNQTKKVRSCAYFPARAQSDQGTIPKDKNNIHFLTLEQLEEQGKNATLNEHTLAQRPEKKDVALIMYTSGSTGTPKGVSLTHESVVAAITGEKERVFPMINVDEDIYIAYLPLAHILELCCEILSFYLGVKCGYSSPQTLTDQSTSIRKGDKGDLAVLKPHLMACVPTILDRMHKTINEKIKQSNIFKRLFFHLTYQIKVHRLEYGLTSPILDRWIFSSLNKMVLGGQVKAMLCGGAALSEETQRFVQTALCVQIFQGYGLTETAAAGTIADQFDITSGRVGYPLLSTEIRLVNWDEGQYKTSDQPNPRGEILIGGKVVAQGYYGEAQKENENFKEIDGTRYFCTGDIGEMFPDGTLKIIDRKKDLIKLRSGEYVSLTKIEGAINGSALVENCCLCASSESDHTVVLISPKTKEIESFAQKNFKGKNWKELVDDEQFNKQILEEIQDACKKGGIDQGEIPKAVKVVSDPWTPDTGLVTDALKLKRKAIEEKYKEEIEQLYQGDGPTDSKQKPNNSKNKDQ